jgi:hypothetical protein
MENDDGLEEAWLELIVQDNAKKRAVHLQHAVVVDETQLSKLVHEEIHSSASCANHFRQNFLTHPWDHGLGLRFFSHSGEY